MTVAPTLNVTIPTGPVILNLNSTNKTFAYDDINVTVSTNNPTGYELTMSSSSTSLNRDSSGDGKTATIETLPTLAGGYDDSTFVVNKWGYKNGIANNYFPLSNAGDTISKSYYATSGITNTLRFASKINNDQPAGSYSTTLSFNVTAYPLMNYMQNMSLNTCPSDSPLLVIDRRDNQEYYIQKLKDGNCWMLNNLKLGKSTTTLELDNELSDVPAAGFTLTNKSSDGKFTNNTVDGTEYQNNNSQYYCTNDYGCYYNWYTATGGSGTTATASGSVSNSICPKGWTLPTQSQFQILYSNYPSATQMLVSPTSATENTGGASAPGFLRGGFYYSSGAGNVGSDGLYWSRTAYSTEGGYNLNLMGTSSVYTGSTYGKYVGNALRCVMRDTRTLNDIEYMQDINTFIVENTASGASKTLTDKRDNSTYAVKKIANNIWMTQNLRLAAGTKITNENSNISNSTYTLPADSTSDYSSSDYNTAKMHCSGDTAVGCYYNYAAASAGTISGSNNSNNATNDICPKSWRLPVKDEISLIVNYKNDFSPVGGGFCDGNCPTNPTSTSGAAVYLSSTASSGTSRWSLYYTGNLSVIDYIARYGGDYVRCVVARN